MPLIEVTYAAGTMSDQARDRLISDLPQTLLRWEGAPDTEFFREITWTYLHELPADRIVVNGRPAAPARARYKIDITVPEGALSERRRDGLIADVTALVLDACEPGERPADSSMRVWVLVHEQPDGWWGAAGVSVQFAQLRQLAAEERSTQAK
jgi:phenylpyruvate tautomerase PptA (4-oxalocrotonate tautomerase family)